MTSLAVDAHTAAARLDVRELGAAAERASRSDAGGGAGRYSGSPVADPVVEDDRSDAGDELPAAAWRTGCGTLIAGQESDQVARSWFIAGNPLLGEDTPAHRDPRRRSKDVGAAAEGFMEDQPAT